MSPLGPLSPLTLVPHLQAAFSPAFIHRPEGRRFLASLFNLDKGFVGELTAIIKNQVWGVGVGI